MELLSPAQLAARFLKCAPRLSLLTWGAASLLLALSSAAYGVLVGPLLRVAFSGELPELPHGLERYLPALTVSELRAALPWAIAGVSSLKGLAYFVERYCLALLAISFSQAQRGQLLTHVRALSVDELEARGRGLLHRLFTADLELLERWVIEGWAPLLRDGLQVIALGATALLISGEIGVWVLLFYPAIMAPLLSLRRLMKRRVQGELKALRGLSQWVHSLLDRLQVSKLYQTRSELSAELELMHLELRREQRARAALLALTPPLTELTSALSIAIGLGWFLEGVVDGRWSAEQLISLFVCLVMMYPPLKSISKAHRAWLSARDVLGELDALSAALSPHSVEERALPLELKRFEWRELTITRGARQLSAPLAFSVERGQILRVSGANGSGKSSLIYQLLGLNPSPSSAQLMLNHGYKSTGSQLREAQQVAWLPQGSPLPASDLRQLGDLLERCVEYPSDQLAQALGLNIKPEAGTPLTALSGGERQKWSLYLTLMSGRPLVILDEPEAHLDHESLKALAHHLVDTRQRRACLLITHHPTLSALADQDLELSPYEPLSPHIS